MYQNIVSGTEVIKTLQTELRSVSHMWHIGSMFLNQLYFFGMAKKCYNYF